MRIIEFEGYDICACCAPHVKRSGQIGVIKLLDFANYKGGVRIHILCGMRALADYQEKYRSVLEVSNMLSAKQSEISDAVLRLKGENEQLKQEMFALRRAVADELVATAEKTDKNIVFFSSLLDAQSLRYLASAGLEKCGGISAAFSPKDGGYSFCMASKTVNLKEKSKEIGEVLHGRGGGSADMISGSVSATKEAIEAYLK